MLGKPPNLPLGPLQGVLAKEDPVDAAPADTGIVPDATDLGTDCETTGSAAPGSGTDVVDPAAADPAAVDTTATDTTATDVDPCAETATGTGAETGLDATGTGTGTGTADDTVDATGTGAGAGATSTPSGTPRATTDGTNTGNSPEALRIAADTTKVMGDAKIQVSTTATLVPSAGGVGTGTAVRRYRSTVTASVLVIKLDATALEQWTTAGKTVQRNLVRSFITRLGKAYRRASRSVTVVDSAGSVLAVGDAVRGASGTVKIY